MAKNHDETEEKTLETDIPARVGDVNHEADTFTKEIGDEICAELSTGRSLIGILNSEKRYPSMKTWFRWMRTYPDLEKAYGIAKLESADAMAEEILEISDDGSNDWMERHYGDNSVWVENGEATRRSVLRVDTRKWLMAKHKPKRYGDKLDLTSDNKALPTPIYGGLSSNGKKRKLND